MINNFKKGSKIGSVNEFQSGSTGLFTTKFNDETFDDKTSPDEQFDFMEQICKVLNQKSQENDEKKVAKEAEIIAQECKKTRNLSKFREFLKTNMKASTSSFLIGTLSSLASSAIWEFVIKAIIA